MSFNDRSTKLNSEGRTSSDQPVPIPSPEAFNSNSLILHIAPSAFQDDHPSSSQVSLCSSQDSAKTTIEVFRRHFVIHGPSCRSSMGCDQRGTQAPAATRRVVGLPRAHFVASSLAPTRYNVNALWARPLSRGPLVEVGDKIWVEGVGEVELGESIVHGTSPFWKFFSAFTPDYPLVEMATEWCYV